MQIAPCLRRGGRVALASLALAVSQINATSFVVQHQSPGASTLRAVAGHADRMVAVGDAGWVLVSDDGLTWSNRTPPVAQALRGVAYGNSVFVAVGETGTILHSPDGEHWTRAPATEDEADLNAIAFADGMFFAVGAAGTLRVSTDGRTWTARDTGFAEDFTSAAVGHAGWRFLIGGAGGIVLRSRDLQSWTQGLMALDDVAGVAATSTAEGQVFVSAAGECLIEESRAHVSAEGVASTTSRWASGALINRPVAGVTAAPDGAIAFGPAGTLIQESTTYFGRRWRPLDPVVGADLHGGATIGAHTYVVGAEATILRSGAVTPGYLVNLSTRAYIAPPAAIHAGFVLTGAGTQTILVRGIGPGLTGHGVGDALSTPRLQVFDQSGAQLGENRSWQDQAEAGAVRAAAELTGAFALGEGVADGALLLELPAGVYSAVVSSATTATGTALVEIYQVPGALGFAAGPRLANLSTRATVSAVTSPLIAGFRVVGDVPRQLLIRGVGPTLAEFGVSPTISRIDLALHNGSFFTRSGGTWGFTVSEAGANRAAAQLAGAFPLVEGSSDMALRATVDAGSYSAMIYTDEEASGEVLVELYDLAP